MGALRGGYKEVSSEFSKLAENVQDTTTTIRRPESVQQTLEREMPLLSVEKSDNEKDKKPTSFSSETISADTNDNNNNNDGNTKKITI